MSLFINAGLAGVVVVMLITGILVTGREYTRMERTVDKLQEALDIERRRNSDLLLWASTGTRAIQAVAQVATERAPGVITPPQGMPQARGGLCTSTGGGTAALRPGRG